MYSLQKSLQTVHPQPLPWLEALWERPAKPLLLQQQCHMKEKWLLPGLETLCGRPVKPLMLNPQLQHPLREPTGLSPGSVQLTQQRGQGGCSTRNRTPNKCLSWLSRPFVPTISQRLMFDINRFFFFPDQPTPSESCSQAMSILAAGLQYWSEKALTALGLLQAGCLSCEPQDPFPPAFP